MNENSRLQCEPEREPLYFQGQISTVVGENTLLSGSTGNDARNGACAARPAEKARQEPLAGSSVQTTTGGEAPLGNTQVILHPGNESRAKRYELRAELRSFSGIPRVCKCGNTPVSTAGVGVRLSELSGKKVAGFSGVSTCGSVWVCPVCSAKIGAKRSQEVSEILHYAHDQNMKAAMMTFTVRHHKGQSLKDVWNAVSKGWARVTGGKAWKEDVSRFKIQGWLRAVEVTYGKHGWHVHTHAVMIYDASWYMAEHHLGDSLWKRWEKGISKVGFTAVADSGGFDVSLLENGSDLGGYFSKQCDAFSKEVTLGAFKTATGENYTPFQLLRFFTETGDMEALKVWHEWEKGSRGRRQMLWSKGLREWAQLGQEATDEAIAEEEIGTCEDTIVVLPAESWNKLKARSWVLLDVAESGGKRALVGYLDSQGIAWFEPPIK